LRGGGEPYREAAVPLAQRVPASHPSLASSPTPLLANTAPFPRPCSQIPLGRRFRSLKLHFVLQMYGAKALREGIRRHVGLAARFADAVAGDARFELPTPPSLALVCFRITEAAACSDAADAGTQALSADQRLKAANKVNNALLDKINASGQAFLVHTKLSGRLVLRLAVGSPLTQEADVDAAWALVRAAADELLAGASGKA
jgi:aromatic-L-amino-acid/L-tryptophan decarboxylase